MSKIDKPIEKPAEPVLANPTEGGSYIRNGDGSLTTVHQTKPVQGRVQASREALEKRTNESPKE